MNNLNLRIYYIIAFKLTLSIADATTTPKPNFLFIFTDDQRYDMVGAIGNPEVKTPHLDQLAEEGSVFTHAYNMGAWNGAVCVASRAMMISGLPVWEAHRAEREFEERAERGEFWPQLLQAAGYETYMTGKWHVKANAEKVFQHVTHVRPGMPNQTPEGYDRPKDEADTLWQPWQTHYDGFWQGGQHWSEVLADDATTFLNQASQSDQPFIMYLAFNAPHDPRQSPRPFVEAYDISQISLPPNFKDLYPDKDSVGLSPDLRDEALAPFPRTPYSVKKNIQEYYALITHMDEQIGKIIAALEESGKRENTYIIFTSDHGLAVGHHGLMGKQNMYDHSVRAPLMLVGPGIPASRSFSQQVYLQDVSATMLDLANVEKPASTVFHSLMPIIQNNGSSPYPAIYSCYLDLQRMVRSDSHKLIVYPKLKKLMLFDMQNDPDELHDLARSPKHTQIKLDLIKQLEELQRDYGDTLDLSELFRSHFPNIDLSAYLPGGNATIVSVSRDTVSFKPDLRDTEGHWFYWHFKASSQQPGTWHFKSTEPNTLTNRGVAYSRDGGQSWDWISKEDHLGEDLFRFTFTTPDETVRFSMGMPYTESDFNTFITPFLDRETLKLETLTLTRQGRPVEKLLISDFSKTPKVKIVFAARAHACEMMSNYVMEGMIAALLGASKAMKKLLSNADIMMIPFVDKDGVEEGDQGKNRRPRDHNRDYAGESIYASTAAIREQVPKWVGDTPWIGIDLHNPWIKGENNEWIYLVGNANPQVETAQKQLVEILAEHSRGPLKFTKEQGFLPFGTAWNTGTNYDQGASFAQWASQFEGKGLMLTTTLEFPYALNHGQTITADSARAFGEDLIHALAAFVDEK